MASGGVVTVEADLAPARAAATVTAAHESHPPAAATVAMAVYGTRLVAAPPGLAVAAHTAAAATLTVEAATKVAVSEAEVAMASAVQAVPALKLCDVCFAQQVSIARCSLPQWPSLILP